MEGGAGSIPGQGTKMPHASAAWPNQINKSRAEWGGGKTNITHHQYGCGATQDSYTLTHGNAKKSPWNVVSHFP